MESAGIFSPGFTSRISPILMSSISISFSTLLPSASVVTRVAVFGWRPMSSLIDEEVFLLALASRYLPIVKNEGNITADS